jgi:hypothetical protein
VWQLSDWQPPKLISTSELAAKGRRLVCMRAVASQALIDETFIGKAAIVFRRLGGLKLNKTTPQSGGWAIESLRRNDLREVQ